MITENYRFFNESGHLLAAKLEKPEDGPLAYAVFAHCFAGSKDMLAPTRISRALTKARIAVLRFDFTGLGESGGDFANTTFSSQVTDIIFAAKFLEESFKAPRLLIGHSLGGAAAIAAASLLPNIRALATIGAPSNTTHVSHLFKEHIGKIEKEGTAIIKIAGRELQINKQFLDDIKTHYLEGILYNLNKPLLIFHSPIDETVNIDHARILYKAARHPKSFIAIDQGDHLLTHKRDAEFVSTLLAAWANRYIEE